LINFEKLKMFSDIIYSVALSDITDEGQVSYSKLYQQHPQLRAFLLNLTFYDEDTLYEYSLKHSELYQATNVPPITTSALPVNPPPQNPPSPSESIYANMITWNNPVYMAKLPSTLEKKKRRRKRRDTASRIWHAQVAPALQSEISLSLSNFGSTVSKATKSIIPAFSTAFNRQAQASLSPVPLSDNASSDPPTETDSTRSCDDFNSITSSDDISQPSTISESETPPIQTADELLTKTPPAISIMNMSEDITNSNEAEEDMQSHANTQDLPSVELEDSQIVRCVVDSTVLDLDPTQIALTSSEDL